MTSKIIVTGALEGFLHPTPKHRESAREEEDGRFIPSIVTPLPVYLRNVLPKRREPKQIRKILPRICDNVLK
jgi:hypothetical protein